jgi:hypothetical protein
MLKFCDFFLVDGHKLFIVGKGLEVDNELVWVNALPNILRNSHSYSSIMGNNFAKIIKDGRVVQLPNNKELILHYLIKDRLLFKEKGAIE